MVSALRWGQNFVNQTVRVRISVEPYIFMIWLTFVRIFTGFYCTVGGTTRFWSARYGFESQHLAKFFPLHYDFEFSAIVSFLLPSKFLFPAALRNKKLIVVGTLFFIIIIVFKITTNFQLFSLIVFPGISFWCIQRQQFMRSPNKYSQTPKLHSYEFFWFSETKYVRRKILMPPLIHKIFGYKEFSETQNGFLYFFWFHETKKNEKRDTPVKPSCSIQEAFRNTKKLNFRYFETKSFPHFLVITSDDLSKFSHRIYQHRRCSLILNLLQF